MADQVTEETSEETTDVTDGDEPLTLENARKLRAENKTLRDRAKDAEAKADEHAQALFRARVEATGKLASPDELAFNATLLDDPDALNTAIDELITRKPYVKARAFADVGQGHIGENAAPKDFSALFR